jgi:spore coat polysaccharide biosynthesis predicted glycosyltransferase SpsG
MHLAIRADGGPDIGYGHLLRSNALAEEFLTRNHKVTVATTRPQPAQAVFPDAVEVIEISSRGDPGPFVSWLNANQPDAVFTDSYPADTKYQQTVRNRVPLAVLQDDDRHAICADLFINGNLYATDLDYEFVGDAPKTCLGADYVFLRSEIRNRVGDEPPWRERPERALITMGGSDIANLTPRIVRAFDGFELAVDAIVGPGFSKQQEQEVRDAATKVTADVMVVRDPEDLPERMFEADFAVSTSSTTTYELLALGTPIISCPVVDNQEPIAAALRERNVATVVIPEERRETFSGAIETYVIDSKLRRERAETGRMLVDALGTERVCAEILSLGNENARS